VNKQILFDVIVSSSSNVKEQDLDLLNEGAPNSWTIHDKKNGEVWKIIKGGTHKKNDYLLEKEALERIPTGLRIVKYIRSGVLNINGETKNYPYLIFPYINESKPLDRLIYERRKLDKPFLKEEITSIGKQVINLIFELHKVDVVHQDVKPGNILINKKGEVFLIDLGIAMFMGNDLKEIKKMKGPYAYLSPEKLDLISDLSDSNKRKLSFTSDLFSVGMILFEMATFKRLTDIIQPGEIRTAYTRLIELGAPEELIDVLSSLLDGNILERQKKVGGLFSKQWLKKENKLSTILWLQHGSNGIDYLDQYVAEHKFDIPWGVIYGADQIREDKNKKKFLERIIPIKEKHGLVAVDPCTYRLKYSDEHHSYLIHHDYWQIISAGIFLNERLIEKGKDFVNEVYKFQEIFNPDIIFSPYFIIENVDDRWVDANFKCFDLTYQIFVENKIAKPLYFGFFLSENFIKNERAVDEVLTQIILNKRIKNIYLRLESIRGDSEPNEDPIYLQNVKKIVTCLLQYKNILFGFSDVTVLGWMCLGLNEIGINPDYSKRKCQVIGIMDKPKKEIHIPEKQQRYFAQVLLNDVLSQDELRSQQAIVLGSDAVFHCDCPFCFIEGKDRRLDNDQSRKHFLWHFEKIIKMMDGQKLDERKKIFSELLDKSNVGYKHLKTKCGIVFHKSSDDSFIPVWRSIILA